MRLPWWTCCRDTPASEDGSIPRQGDQHGPGLEIAPGEHAEDWQVFRQQGCIGLGWLRNNDYQSFQNEDEILRALEQQHGENTSGYGRGAAKMIWRFVHDVQLSDIVVANDRYNRVVGIGVVQSAYLPPASPHNPMRNDDTTHRHHVRRVNWIVTRPVDLDGDRFFVQSTLWPLEVEKVDMIRKAYLDAYPDDTEVIGAIDRVFGPDADDSAVEAATKEGLAKAERQLGEERAFDPTGIEDARERVLSSIVRRRGQSGFRNLLLSAYQGQCAITGCAVEAVLEAAHIIPYKGTQTNHVGNGLLLRGDWHTLFDLRLVTVDGETMRLVVSPKLAGTGYDKYDGETIRLPEDPANWPSKEALKQHQRESGLP
jgi:hypothetical protein